MFEIDFRYIVIYELRDEDPDVRNIQYAYLDLLIEVETFLKFFGQPKTTSVVIDTETKQVFQYYNGLFVKSIGNFQKVMKLYKRTIGVK